MSTTPSFEKRIERAQWRQQLNEILMQNEKERFEKEEDSLHNTYIETMRSAKAIHNKNMQDLREQNSILSEDIKLYNLLSKVRDGKLELRFSDTGKRCNIQFV